MLEVDIALNDEGQQYGNLDEVSDGLPCTTGSNQSGVPQWWTRESFHQLPPQEQAVQREEAYARATVALTRAQQICFLMGPLDMRGLVGVATTWNMAPASVGKMTRMTPSSLSGLRMRICWKHLMMRHFWKAYDTPVQELVVSIHHWPWWKPTLLRRTVPLGCEGCTWS